MCFSPRKGSITDRETQFHQLSGWLVSDDPAGEEAGCGGPGLAWLHVFWGCEACWKYCQILKNNIEVVYGREMNIKLFGNSSGGHSCSQHTKCTLLQNICGIVWQNCTFIVSSTKCNCVMIMLFNQLLHIPHLSVGWIILAKGNAH